MAFAIGLLVGIAGAFMVARIVASKKLRKSYLEGYIDGRNYVLALRIPIKVLNQGGTPLSVDCPRCGAQITKPSSPVGCKWCLQRVKWEGENEDE